MRLPRPFRRKALTGSGDLPAVLQGGWTAIAVLGGGAQERIQNAYTRAQSENLAWLYENSPALRSVIDTIVRNVGQLELRLYEEIAEDERQPRPDHPAALSMRYPNKDTSADQFIRQLVQDFLIYDNAYALITPAAGNELTLNWLPAHMIAVLGSSLFSADVYRFWRTFAGGFYQPAGLPYVDFTPDQILHWHGRRANDPRIGMSRLETLRGILAEDVAMRTAMVELAQAGLQEPIWVKRPLDAPPWSNEARRGFEEEITARIKRRNEKVPVLEEGMEMMSFGVTPHDAEMMEVRRWIYSQIAGAYGLPLGMIGLGTSPAEDQMRFYSDCLYPLCREFTSMLDHRLLVQAYDWTAGCFELKIDEKFMGDDRLRALVSATGRPVMVTNEARAKLNLPPVQGGDELVTPLNVVVGDNPKPSTDVMPPQDPNKPPQDGSYREIQGPTPIPPKALVKAQEFEQLPQLHPGRASEMERQRRNIDLMKGAVQRHLGRLERSVRAKNGTTDWPRFDREFATDLDRDLKRIVDHEGAIYAMKLSGGNFDMGLVQHYLQAMAESAAGALNDTVKADVEQHGVDAAFSRTPQHVANAGRSLGVAATTWAREEAARQSPQTDSRVKTWIADTGRHAELDGMTVALADEWPAGFAPGGEPGCACTESIT